MPKRLLREIEGDEMGDFFIFEKLGDSLEGTYVKQRVTTGGNYGPQDVYDIRKEDGSLATVNGKWDIKSKMAKVPVGSYVKITYVNNKEMPPNRDGSARNPMMVFRVETDAATDAKPRPPIGPSDGTVPF